MLLLGQIVFLSACSWFAPERVTEGERRSVASRFKEAIERAGGDQVWVKGAAHAVPLTAQTDAPIEVLAVPAAFDRVLSEFRRQAEKDGFKIRVEETRSRHPKREALIRLAREKEQVGRWRLREVPQLRRAAIVIDDLGQDLEAARKLLELPYPLTISVLPHLRHSVKTAGEAHRAGREVILHLPMEPRPGATVTAGQGVIMVGMPAADVARIVRADADSVPHIMGVNNHMGSRATADPALMTAVMQVLAERRLYFLDSRTTAGSVALDVARRMGVPAFYRSVFLDEKETVAYTLEQLREFRRVVEAQGAALAIGHPHPATLAALAEFLPEFDRDDIQLVPASRLVHLPEVARLQPPRPAAP